MCIKKKPNRKRIKEKHKSQKNRITKKDKVIALLSFIGIFSAAVFLAFYMFFFGHSDVHEKSDIDYEFVANEEVCMRNNSYRAELIPSISIENRSYYGCCESCTDYIQKHPEERYAVDPTSETKVDKALAYILHPTENEITEVYYFASKENAKVFINENTRL